ncbi:unnamed protein product [Dovyalis caffra]|uniref:Uncharacterized protein n=1 Tax=Dovyalis caffra TaxID=77055 RepID=A0AAV1RP29_9ROSI|nr:unnamed protein product [Dovyalis caffra]
MGAEAGQQKKPSQIVRLDNAFKLAEQWINNMSKAVEDEPPNVESEGRPSRLGLGAKEVPRQSKARQSNDPVERRLHAKLEAGKRRAAKSIEDSILPARDDNADDDSSEESESRTKTFAKKRPGPLAPSLHVKKKQNDNGKRQSTSTNAPIPFDKNLGEYITTTDDTDWLKKSPVGVLSKRIDYASVKYELKRYGVSTIGLQFPGVSMALIAFVSADHMYYVRIICSLFWLCAQLQGLPLQQRNKGCLNLILSHFG